MSFKFSPKSEMNLSQTHPDLQKVFNEVIKLHDCSVICGFRSEYEQNKAYQNNSSKHKWPNSKHNRHPSMAIDVVPYPLDWKDFKRFFYFAGIVKAVASSQNIKLRWGGDFNMNGIFTDERFVDLPHYELLIGGTV